MVLQSLLGEKMDEIIYNDDEQHKIIKTYYHEETGECRVLVQIGMNEFCPTEFIIEDIDKFHAKIEAKREYLIEWINNFNGSENIFVKQKGISDWKYAKELPKELEGFELYIDPEKSLEITNGSFVIINYVDFAINSDLVIYYNMFSNDFGSEMRIKGNSIVTYDFDAENLEELEDKLRYKLNDQLKFVRKSALSENENG